MSAKKSKTATTTKKGKGKTRTKSYKKLKVQRPRRASAMTLVEQAEMDIALSKAAQREMEVRELFAKLDKDRSGYIDRAELRPFLLSVGFNETSCTHAGFERFLTEEFARADTSGDEQIDFHEFVALNNRLVDTQRDIDHLNYAISLIADNEAATNQPGQGYLERVERLATANKSVQQLTINVVAQLGSLGSTPTPEVLQIFTCILILFGLPERETPEEDWACAQHQFEGPNFLEELKTFDHTKLRRAQVQRCVQRSQTLVSDLRLLEKQQPLAFSLLCWVLLTIAQATKAGVLDQVDVEEAIPLHRRASFAFSVGTNARKGVFRILDSDLFEGNFIKKRDPKNPGVTLQVGQLEDNHKKAVNAIYFDRTKFTEEQAHVWWTAHKTDPQFATALEKMESPRVDVSSFDFSTDDMDAMAIGNKKPKPAGLKKGDPNTVEQWGYNEAGEFVCTIVLKEDAMGGSSTSTEVNGCGNAVVEGIVESIQSLQEQEILALGQLESDPGHGEASICVVAVLLGSTQAPTNWEEAKTWCVQPGRLNSLQTMDVRVSVVLFLETWNVAWWWWWCLV
jgi:Ca2+-binding EF-hand superfamily protein